MKKAALFLCTLLACTALLAGCAPKEQPVEVSFTSAQVALPADFTQAMLQQACLNTITQLNNKDYTGLTATFAPKLAAVATPEELDKTWGVMQRLSGALQKLDITVLQTSALPEGTLLTTLGASATYRHAVIYFTLTYAPDGTMLGIYYK